MSFLKVVFGFWVEVVFGVVVEVRLSSSARAPTSVVDDFWAIAAFYNLELDLFGRDERSGDESYFSRSGDNQLKQQNNKGSPTYQTRRRSHS